MSRRAVDFASRKRELAVKLAQCGNAAGELEPIAGESEFAGDLVAVVVADRQFQLESELALAARFGAAGRMIEPLVDRAFGDEAQEIRGRPDRLALDAQRRMGDAHIRDLDLDPADRGIERAAVVAVDADARSIDPDLAVEAGQPRPVRRVVERHSLCLGGQRELALFAIRERKVGEIPRDLEARIARAAGEQAGAYPFAHAGPGGERHIAIQLRRIDARQLRTSVDRARPVGERSVFAADHARGIRVGEGQLLELDCVAFGGFTPAQLSFCGVEHQCLREQMRPVHGKRAAVELDRSVVVGCGDAAGETGDA